MLSFLLVVAIYQGYIQYEKGSEGPTTRFAISKALFYFIPGLILIWSSCSLSRTIKKSIGTKPNIRLLLLHILGTLLLIASLFAITVFELEMNRLEKLDRLKSC